MVCEPRAFLNHWDEVPAVWSACCTTQPAFSRTIYMFWKALWVTALLFHCWLLPNFWDELYRESKLLVISCKYNCPLPQVQDETLLPWLISCCHNTSLSISWFRYILNAFLICGGELSCFTCIDHLCNLTHHGLKHLPLQIHSVMGFKKGKCSLHCIADHLLVMKIILEERGSFSQ